MDGELMPTRWYYPSCSSGPVPCRWEGWAWIGGESGRREWVVIDLFAA